MTFLGRRQPAHSKRGRNWAHLSEVAANPAVCGATCLKCNATPGIAVQFSYTGHPIHSAVAYPGINPFPRVRRMFKSLLENLIGGAEGIQAREEGMAFLKVCANQSTRVTTTSYLG